MERDHTDFQILGETSELLIVNKPAGLLVHPSKPHSSRTLWDGLRDLLGYELVNGGQISLINRLDRETSGIVLVAKTSSAARTAAIAMQEGRICKTYLAIVCGWPLEDKFEVDAPIIRRGEIVPSRIWLKRIVHPDGATAHTKFEVLSRIYKKEGKFALVKAHPLTGRTHQIRVHLAYSGYSVVGDKIYGPSEDCYLEFIANGWTDELARQLFLDHQALHSAAVAFEWKGATLEWTCPLPADLTKFLTDSQHLLPNGKQEILETDDFSLSL